MKDERTEKEGILLAAAKALGSAAGKLAALAKTGEGNPGSKTAKSVEPGVSQTRFAPRAKSRLPRKLKKANKKAAALAR